MFYGHPPHVHSPEDVTILHCYKCGWVSGELGRAQIAELGIPWYCENCHKPGLHFVCFHPSERAQALALLPSSTG